MCFIFISRRKGGGQELYVLVKESTVNLDEEGTVEERNGGTDSIRDVLSDVDNVTRG